jgi:ubiquinone/menaquinone biosynthesis C-methylase UbiE
LAQHAVTEPDIIGGRSEGVVDVFQWIEETLRPKTCHSEEFIYDDMDSQSGRSLPIIYVPFDAGIRAHWRDRGALFDYLCAAGGEGKRLLDFGPGDGWPSLIVAPFAAGVVGVDGSRRRVEVCTENAKRLGAANAEYVFAAPGAPLPFDDESFEGAMAASSVEQTPDPQATLRELYRVLRPGGRLRMHYEALAVYGGGRERDQWLWKLDAEHSRLILYDRDITRERVRQYGLTYAIAKEDLLEALSDDGQSLSFSMITVRRLESLASSLTNARSCTTTHPSGATLTSWLHEVGFSEVSPTHSGAVAAGMLFDTLPEADRPADMRGVDALVRPLAEIVSQLPAPLGTDPMITALR